MTFKLTNHLPAVLQLSKRLTKMKYFVLKLMTLKNRPRLNNPLDLTIVSQRRVQVNLMKKGINELLKILTSVLS